MKNSFLLLSAIIGSSIFIVGCIKNIDYGNNVEDYTKSSGNTNIIKEKSVFMKGDSLSGINISGHYNDILISGDNIVYSGMFTITIPKEINKREYTKTYYAGTDTYMDKLMLNDENAEINFSVKSYRTALPVSEICYYNTEYGGKLSSKKIMDIGGINVYFLNSSFLISSPDTKQWTSEESSICFIKGNVVYKLLVSSNIKYRDDIINSFKFLE